MINICYLSHNRTEFKKYWRITSHILNNIKPENKDKVKLSILATNEIPEWEQWAPDDIETELVLFEKSDINLMEKIRHAAESDTEYIVKHDEDVFFSSHVWDYIIENIDVLQNEDNLLITPLLSNNIPLVDTFIPSFIEDEEIRNKMNSLFASQEMPNGLWGVDYSPLNEYTINATEWNPEAYYAGVSNLPTNFKGIHPMRICAEAQIVLNDYILDNFDKMLAKHEYGFAEMAQPYFTTSTFFMRTETLAKIVNMTAYDAFEEVQLNMYRHEYNKKLLYVSNGFGIHTMYNTVYGNKNIWNIGMEDGYTYEVNLVESINQKLGL